MCLRIVFLQGNFPFHGNFRVMHLLRNGFWYAVAFYRYEAVFLVGEASASIVGGWKSAPQKKFSLI